MPIHKPEQSRDELQEPVLYSDISVKVSAFFSFLRGTLIIRLPLANKGQSIRLLFNTYLGPTPSTSTPEPAKYKGFIGQC